MMSDLGFTHLQVQCKNTECDDYGRWFVEDRTPSGIVMGHICRFYLKKPQIKECPTCNGAGILGVTGGLNCFTCGGSGILNVKVQTTSADTPQS